MNQTPKDEREEEFAQSNNPEQKTAAERIDAPTGLDLHPQPKHAVRVSKRAGLAIGAVGFALLVAFAYGAYRRQAQAQEAVRDSGLPKSVTPATTAGNEFLQEVPAGNALVVHKDGLNQLQPPSSTTGGSGMLVAAPCPFDPRTGQPYHFNPDTGQPCPTYPQRYPQDRLVVRQAPVVQSAVEKQATPEERRMEAARQREQEAILAPTGIRSGANSGGSTSMFGSPAGNAPTPSEELAQVAALSQALAGRTPDSGGQAATLGRVSLSSGFSAVTATMTDRTCKPVSKPFSTLHDRRRQMIIWPRRAVRLSVPTR